MGINVEVLLDIGFADITISKVLERLQITHSGVVQLWDSSFEIPVNAGIRALNVKRFKEEFSQNWSLIEHAEKGCVVDADQTKWVSFPLKGPYGFSASLFQDSIIIESRTRWGEFRDDLSCQTRFIETISMFAQELSSTRVYFLPDSYYLGSECSGLLLDGGGFNDVFDCLRVSGANFVSVVENSCNCKFQIYI